MITDELLFKLLIINTLLKRGANTTTLSFAMVFSNLARIDSSNDMVSEGYRYQRIPESYLK